jgi:hypothetical protein
MKQSLLVIMSIFLFLTGCAHITADKTVPSLQERISTVWQAKVDKKWDEVYDHSCREWRAKISEAAFLRSANMTITSFKTEKIQRSADGKEATVTIRFNTDAMGMELKGVKIKERWVYEDNNWYVCPKGDSAKRLFEK